MNVSKPMIVTLALIILVSIILYTGTYALVYTRRYIRTGTYAPVHTRRYICTGTYPPVHTYRYRRAVKLVDPKTFTF